MAGAEEAQEAVNGLSEGDALLVLVRECKWEEAREVLLASPHLWRAADQEGFSVLHWAALSGSADFVSKALAAGCAPDTVAKNGQTPLMWAVIRGHVSTSKLLLDARADVTARDSLGASPLILAIQHQKQASFLMLVAAEATRERLLRVSDNSGCGPVHWAAYKGCMTSLRLLDYFDADFGALDNVRMTPLHRAVTARSSQVYEYLLDHNVDPSAKDEQGRNCLDLTKDNGDTSSRKALLRLLDTQGRPKEGVQADEQDDMERGGQELRRRAKKDPMVDLKMKFAHNAAATFWIVSVSLSTFQYLTDIRETSWKVAPNVALAFELGVPASLALFLITVQLDPGKVPPRPKRASGVEEILRSLESSGEADVDRLCTTTWVLKGPRTKFCTRTDACVREFDHFCGWLNVAIGRGNHRPFIFLSIVEPAVQFCHVYLIWVAMGVQVEPPPSDSSWLFAVCAGYPLMIIIGILHCLTAPMVTCLAFNQLRLILVNLTTNEMLNAYRYGHFWQEVEEGGVKKKKFKNPFHKGSWLSNCLDFWWTRRREDRGPSPVIMASMKVQDKSRTSRAGKAESERAI